MKKKNGTLAVYRSSRSDWHVLQRRCQPTPTPIYIKRFTASVPTEANYYMYFIGGQRLSLGSGQLVNIIPVVRQTNTLYFPLTLCAAVL